MRMLRINWGSIGTIGETALGSLSRLALYWPFSWRGVSAIILGVLLAKWTWILFSPQAIYASAVREPAAGQEAGQLFGIAQMSDTTSQGVALPNVQLLGIFTAGGGKPGFAVLKLDNSRQKGVAEGEEVAAGAKLIAVNADHVLIERAGVQQRVNLENKFAGSPGSARIMSLPAFGAAAAPRQVETTPPAYGAIKNYSRPNDTPDRSMESRWQPPDR